MTHYIRAGATYRVADSDSFTIEKTLPVGTYTVGWDKMAEEYYFAFADDMTISHKVYGDAEKTANRILSTFNSRDNATGVMLAGEQGSGKTMLAKLLSVQGRKQGIPTIVINQAWHGEKFNLFIQMVEQPAIVIFDEFEKTYKAEQQEALLTLLDGVYASKKLFIITCNDNYRVNEHMKNRPGRIFYRKDFTGLDKDFIAEYCRDNLSETHYTESIIKIASTFAEFNFDMLKALVEEMNRYDESPHEAMQLLNAKPEMSKNAAYVATLSGKGKTFVPQSWNGAPLSGNDIRIYFDYDDEDEGLDALFGDSDSTAIFTLDDLVKVEDGAFFFTNNKGFSLKLVKRVVAKYNAAAY
jgi:hypothetical protein